MRVLFASYSEKTQTVFQVGVPLAWALRAAGHEVRVASQPELVPTITAAGLTAVPVGRDHDLWRIQDRFIKRLADRHPQTYDEKVRGGQMPPFAAADEPEDEVTWDYLVAGYRWTVASWYRMANEPMIAELVEFCREWRPDLVIWEPGTYAAPIAAKAVGAAHARLLWSLDFFGRTRDRFLRALARRPAAERVDPLADWLRVAGARFGVEFSEELTTGHFTVEQLPPSLLMTTDQRSVPMRYVPYNGRAVVPRWLWEPPTRPRVALTLGLTMAERFGSFALRPQEVLDSLAELDVEVVATLGDDVRAGLERVPDNVRVVPFVPLHALVPTCSAVVHHAGFGTLSSTALHGVPQLALPEHFDEPPLADRLVAQGSALSVPAALATGPDVRDGVARLLAEPSFGASAGRLRDEVLTLPTPNEFVPRLEKLVATHAG
ncbi:activator-dependent family glycosyltransferase [Actinosynnema sp. NPDC023587]|uniref:activator-dependent family glycosyltransferase n=1 Tax=Actinosynnema sp. NPDC023587 TaxID=3154695 RepID=UPI0034040B20